MTPEEAISVIKTEIGQFIIDKKWKNALALAISALEKQDVPDINVGDMVSRQAAIDALSHMCSEDENGITVSRANVNSMLRVLPSAQPERKKGKWVGYDGDWFKTMCKCSECGAMIDINEKYRNFFCYHCGARMDGEQV